MVVVRSLDTLAMGEDPTQQGFASVGNIDQVNGTARQSCQGFDHVEALFRGKWLARLDGDIQVTIGASALFGDRAENIGQLDVRLRREELLDALKDTLHGLPVVVTYDTTIEQMPPANQPMPGGAQRRRSGVLAGVTYFRS